MSLKKKFYIGIIFILLSTTNLHAIIKKNNKQIYSANYIKNYLYGSILYNQNKHNSVANNLEKNLKLQGKHINYDIKHITSLIINGNFDKAVRNVLKIEDKYSQIFIFDFVKSVHLLKNGQHQKALVQLKRIKSSDMLFNELINTLIFWIEIEKNKKFQKELIKNFRSDNSGITLINQFLASKYTSKTDLYVSLNEKILFSDNFVRYKILSAWNYSREGQTNQSLKILKLALDQNNHNILLKQTYKNFKNKNYNISNFFDPKIFNHNLAEIFYLFSNLYQQREDLLFSDFLLSISLELNENFLSNNLIKFENKLVNNNDHRFNYLLLNNLKNIGDEYRWYINYNLFRHSRNQIISDLEKSLKPDDLFINEKYVDMANYYRLKKDYKSALNYYDKVEKLNINNDWSLYYFKGICYERLKQWKDSEINLKKSISLSSKKYTVINYLAYSWLERRENIDQATKMLEKAVSLSKWEKGYIIDSLGWAYFLKNDYDKAEKLLKIAYEKTAYESEVYDHYGDVLWKQKKFLQARYVWKNALNLENIGLERKKKIKEKIINGLLSE